MNLWIWNNRPAHRSHIGGMSVCHVLTRLFFCRSGCPSGADLDGVAAATHRGRYSLRENSQAVYEESERWERYRSSSAAHHTFQGLVTPIWTLIPGGAFMESTVLYTPVFISVPQKAARCPTPPSLMSCLSCLCWRRAWQWARGQSRGRRRRSAWTWSCSTWGRRGPSPSWEASTAPTPRANSKVSEREGWKKKCQKKRTVLNNYIKVVV